MSTTTQGEAMRPNLSPDQLAREIERAADAIARETGPLRSVAIFRSGAMRPNEVVIMAGEIAYAELERIFPQKR